MQEFNIIGDIAGHYHTMLALLEVMPKTATPLSVGDMVDRGRHSKEVVEFYASGKGLAVLGNHEHMMLDAVAFPSDAHFRDRYYSFGVWAENGGDTTVESYTGLNTQDWHKAIMEFQSYLPQMHLDYLKTLPLFLEFPNDEGSDTLFVSHAPVNPALPFDMVLDLGSSSFSRRSDDCIIWNRGNPRAMPGKFQVYGHNTYRSVRWHMDHGHKWGVCIDTLRHGFLTGIHWPSQAIYQMEIAEADREPPLVA